MRPFVYEHPADLAQILHLGTECGQGQTGSRTQFLAGGTTLIDLMKLDVLTPELVVDIGELTKSHSGIEVAPDGLHLGALARMSRVATHRGVLARYPMIAESLKQAASAQLRNMATLGGNVLQRTRCPYYRDTSWTACNKRNPGSGCAALAGFNRNHAVLGVDDSCISQYPGDFGVALVALDAQVELAGPHGQRTMRFSSLHTEPGGEPQIETTLAAGEVITAFHVPPGPWNRRSLYLKIRDRASYEFAIASAAVALELEDDGIVREVRIGLGGMAYRPWRSHDAEKALIGETLDETTAETAAQAALKGAVTHGYNDYKPELGRRTLIRALMEAKTMQPGGSEDDDEA